MNEEMNVDYCIAGGGIAGLVLASKLPPPGRNSSSWNKGPRFSEDYRLSMLLDSKESLNDFADYNDNVDANSVTPHTTASAAGNVVVWTDIQLH